MTMTTMFRSLLFLLLLLVDSTCASWSDLFDFALPVHPKYSVERRLGFGDYAESPPESCPATTTCAVVCVANASECPTQCNEGETLCNDGSCKSTCVGDEETLCGEDMERCTELPVTCKREIDFYDSCKETYAPFYDAEAACIEEQLDEIELFSFKEPAFLFCYFWISGVSLLTFIWCLLNQKIFPVEGSTVSMGEEGWSQTGYKRHWLGMIIHGMVMTTLWGIQFLLLMLTIFYYMQQGAVTKWEAVFEDEAQVLIAFEVVWFVGLVWSFVYRWPLSVQSLFLRRCTLDKASFVAVVARQKQVEIIDESKFGENLIQSFVTPVNCIFSFLFSYPSVPAGYDITYCEVAVDRMTGTSRFFHRMCRYIYNDQAAMYVIGSMNVGTTVEDFLQQSKGLTSEEATQRLHTVGRNMIPMTKPTILGNIFQEFSKIFYLYQNFMVWTWAPYWYYYMAITQSVVRLTGGVVVGVFQYMSDSVLYQISHVEGTVKVFRDGNPVVISVTDIVPGDVIVLERGPVYCDMVIVQAEHLVVDESALTGEANPIVKTPLESAMKDEIYDVKHHKIHTISAGTTIVECGENSQDFGLVLSTGTFTTKGKLLSDVLSYQRHKFKFDDEVKLVLCILLLQGIFLVTMVFHFLQDQFVFAFFYGVFVLGTVIPPLLPTVFVVSVGISAHRLRQRQITCTYSEGILIAGKVNSVFFDKTGTLTETGMSFVGMKSEPEMTERVKIGMAVCHGLKMSTDGEMLGNHVDKASFQSAGAELQFTKGENVIIKYGGKSYTIIKQNEFDNHRTTQSVVVQDETGAKFAFVKGSPESIRALCDSETIPESFERTLRVSSKYGIYQLALAYKALDPNTDVSTLTRDQIETSLDFCGFVHFQNKIKSDTPNVIKELQGGDVSIAMITGDNVLTGICIAREAGIIGPQCPVLLGRKKGDEIEWVNVDSNQITNEPYAGIDTDLALTGEAWSALLTNDPKYAKGIFTSVRVFGRCNPSDKVSVVTTAVELGFKTLMCGDGQNDCGALKSAHVGIALSSSEASVVAPFTSLEKTITSVVDVLREGRCALSSAFKVYSFYIIYGQLESYLQTIAAYLFISFTEWCWVFMDGFWSMLMAFSLPLASAAAVLSPYRPTASLLGPRTMFSVCGLLAWNFFFLVMAFVALNNEDWYQCRKWSSEDVSNVLTVGDNYESSVLFLLGGFQYMASAFALNFGYTFRTAWYKNYIFVALVTLFMTFQLIATLHPSSFSCIWRVNCDNEDTVRWVTSLAPQPINNPFNTTVMPLRFRLILACIMVINLITLCTWEYFFVNRLLFKLFDFKKVSSQGVLPPEKSVKSVVEMN